MPDPFLILERWLTWLDSHDGRLFRRRQGGDETDWDSLGTIPNPPGSAIFTVGQLRELLTAGRELKRLRTSLLFALRRASACLRDLPPEDEAWAALRAIEADARQTLAASGITVGE